MWTNIKKKKKNKKDILDFLKIHISWSSDDGKRSKQFLKINFDWSKYEIFIYKEIKMNNWK